MQIDETRNFVLLPGMVAGIFWPQQKDGLWRSEMMIFLACAKDETHDWIIGIAITEPNVAMGDHGKIPPIPIKKIVDACNAFPNGWHAVERGRGAYPLPKEYAA